MAKPEEIVYQSSEEKPYITVKKRGGFFFAERLGKDSIAFILYDKALYPKFGLTKEYKDPLDTFLDTAFGGSLDKPGVTIKEIVRDEVKEEAGYTVDNKHLKYLGKRFVSTQMNQYCHLFLIDVTDVEVGDRDPQNETEALAKVVWLSKDDIIKGPCWKATCIISLFDKIKL